MAHSGMALEVVDIYSLSWKEIIKKIELAKTNFLNSYSQFTSDYQEAKKDKNSDIFIACQMRASINLDVWNNLIEIAILRVANDELELEGVATKEQMDFLTSQQTKIKQYEQILDSAKTPKAIPPEEQTLLTKHIPLLQEQTYFSIFSLFKFCCTGEGRKEIHNTQFRKR